MKTALTWISMLLAVAAALIAYGGARVKTPREIKIHVVQPDDYIENPIGGVKPEHMLGAAHSPQLSQLTASLHRQGKWGLAAALCAAASAVLQVAAFLAKE